jgi:hypothetical protein
VVAIVAVAVTLLGACGGSPTDSASGAPTATPRLAPLTPRDPGRIAPEQAEAIAELAANASAVAPDPHAGHVGHDQPGPQGADETSDLAAGDQVRFDEQWARAGSAVPALDSLDEAAAAGYTRAAVQVAGIGVHWVNWTLIDAPFDPARPAMLLFDERATPPTLVGFSYWVRSETEPGGFAGDRDVWHRHTNLCVVNGWIDRESVPSEAECAGHVLAGSDLWMLHAWVVPDRGNRWGDFATHHPALCPSAVGTPDIVRCPTT